MKSFPLRGPLLCLILVGLAACSKHKPAAPPPPRVSVVTVHKQDVPLTRDLVGRLSPYFSANVTARVSGLLLKRVYNEGSQVREGQLLFQIDPTFYKAQLDNNVALLAQDQATYVNNHITAVRNRKLLPVGSVSQQTVDNSDALERSSAAKVKADEALVESSRINLDYTRVTSPISGIAGQQLVTGGAVVGSSNSDTGASGTLLTTVQQIDPSYVNFTISAADLVTLRQAQNTGSVALSKQNKTSVEITLPDGSPYGQLGTLDFTDVTVNATTGAVNLRALVANAQHVLLPGMYVNVTINLGQQNNVILVPQQALLRDTVGSYMYVAGADNKIVRKDIEAAYQYKNSWIVTSGLAEGDRVLVDHLQSVHEAQPVEPVAWQPPTAAPASGAAATDAPAPNAAASATATSGAAAASAPDTASAASRTQ
ncbi:efflux RND transporter periplasmic adaptor subunit [Paraburkholderia humisilvae]|uniref:Toluene efflux pump periplasmic linker protein TtgG n=1 Tax=Paraburkholderia humisilvae TaxID=627669 RepID=A0A6J5DF58_9BURK|nr:efflux RND transporter periplasmic adaptor subunit [Paraburkholderia humisilvae]CAB3751605.1 Toluene efflux pump periplasmic linker protein TtgG [Paraburkholderia humisilvae]